MNRLKPSPDLVSAIASSMMFRTFSRIYENEFGVPLYLESDLLPGKLNQPANESDFCVEMNGGNGSCAKCMYRIFPRPETLMPWTWSSPCRLGQQVTMVPVTAWGKPIAWLVSGHYFVGEPGAGSRKLPDEVVRGMTSDEHRRESLMNSFREIKTIPEARHELMVRFLETCCALIGANLNQFLTVDGREKPEQVEATVSERRGADYGEASRGGRQEAVATTWTGNGEIATRSRLERARRRILRTEGLDADIGLAGREAGWTDDGDFQQDFQECIGESPSEHRRRITGLWSTFSKILAGNDQQLVGSH